MKNKNKIWYLSINFIIFIVQTTKTYICLVLYSFTRNVIKTYFLSPVLTIFLPRVVHQRKHFNFRLSVNLLINQLSINVKKEEVCKLLLSIKKLQRMVTMVTTVYLNVWGLSVQVHGNFTFNCSFRFDRSVYIGLVDFCLVVYMYILITNSLRET